MKLVKRLQKMKTALINKKKKINIVKINQTKIKKLANKRLLNWIKILVNIKISFLYNLKDYIIK